MKICIWWSITTDPWGGGNSFLRALRDELIANGHTISSTPSRDDDVVLVNSWNLGPGKYNSPNRVEQVRSTGSASRLGPLLPGRFWRMLGRRGPAIVHRLDGVAEIVRGSGGRADPVQFGINKISDWTIFQSEYIRDSFARFSIRPKNGSVVYNGVDPHVFYPADEVPSGQNLRFIASSWSPNPDKGFAQIASFSKLPGVEMLFVGRWPESVPSENVSLLGPKNREEIGKLLRTAIGFFHPSKNEGSSNSLVEALASGLPVIYLDSGSNRELAGEYGVELGDDSKSALIEFRNSMGALRERVIEDRERFLISAAARKYLDVFEAAIESRRKEAST